MIERGRERERVGESKSKSVPRRGREKKIARAKAGVSERERAGERIKVSYWDPAVCAASFHAAFRCVSTKAQRVVCTERSGRGSDAEMCGFSPSPGLSPPPHGACLLVVFLLHAKE